MANDRLNDKWVLAIFLFVCLSVGVIGGWYILYLIGYYYPNPLIPTGTPSVVLFTLIWVIIYSMIAVAAWKIYKEPPSLMRSFALCIFIFQLLLNLMWPLALIGNNDPLLGFIDLVILMIVISITGILFWKINAPAGLLFIPYLMWTFYEFGLNYQAWLMNR